MGELVVVEGLDGAGKHTFTTELVAGLRAHGASVTTTAFPRYDDDDYYVAVGAGSAPATNPFLLQSGGTNIKPSDDLMVQSIRAGVNFRF